MDAIVGLMALGRTRQEAEAELRKLDRTRWGLVHDLRERNAKIMARFGRPRKEYDYE